MKKILITIFMLFTIIILGIKVNASTPYGNKTALSVGVEYSDGTSGVDHSNNSYGTYVDMGLTTKKINSTTASNMTGTHSNGTKYLESGIIYLVGHGAYNFIEFINGVKIDNSSYTSGGYIGIRSFNNSKTAMITFGGCNTALQSEASNIANYTYQNGAKITLGWKTELNIASYKNWNSRFNAIIEDKTTSVLSAAQDASDHIYLSNSVKNYKFYGAYNKNPWYFLNTTQIASIPNLDDDLIVLSKEENLSNVKSIEKELLNYNPDINLENYKLEINGVHEIYYDYVLYIDGIRTNLGYTIALNPNNKSIKLIDNMMGLSYEKAKLIVNESNNTSTETKSKMNKAHEKIQSLNEKDNIRANVIDEIKYYDFDENKLYYVVEYELYNNENYIINSYMEEL